MRETPSGEELLIIARKLLREELIPLLPEDRRYDALMVANAMAIAARQMGFGDAYEDREREDLAQLLERTDDGDGGAPGDLHQNLGAKIRRGDFDPGTPLHDTVRDFLLEVTVQRLRESAPNTLKEAGMV